MEHSRSSNFITGASNTRTPSNPMLSRKPYTKKLMESSEASSAVIMCSYSLMNTLAR